jgi:glyoxylase-like metal-dependent hydrolase (beta-lactamase superfamily II)
MNPVAKFKTAAGRCIYTFQVEAFPSLVANIYLIDGGEELLLVDCGSGLERSNRQLLEGFKALHDRFGIGFDIVDIDRILITHGHIDHFGGLPFVRQHTLAPVGVHLLDRRVLSHYEERVVVAARQLEHFLRQAGVEESQQQDLMRMYLFAKDVYRSTPVKFLLQEDEVIAGIKIHHVPGHCPGQVCLQVDDILLTADHVLARTTPHQAPESITLNTGLGHYLASLRKIRALDGISLALGGHEAPIEDLLARIAQIEQFHQARLEKVIRLCREPRSIVEISRALFGRVDGYHVLLALEETGAHVEFLYQRGELLATNLDEIESKRDPIIRYRRA